MTETQENYIFCKHCGAPTRASSTFCTNCGGTSSSDSNLTKSSEPSGGKNESGLLGSIATGLTDTLDKGARYTSERRAAKQRAEYERIHSRSFNSQHEYDNWLKRAGSSIEIIDTTASPRRGLLYSGTIHKTTFTVTYKLQKPPSMQPAPTQVAAPTPPQQPPVMDIPEQIEKLAKLKEKGILTEDEFQSKKHELLSRL